MSCRHDLANNTCSRCYPKTGTVDPGLEEDYEPNMEGPGAISREEYLRDRQNQRNMTISATGIAIGHGACAENGEIALAFGGKQITVQQNGILLNGEPVTAWELIAEGLRDVFGDPGEFLLATPQCSLKIDADGRVFVGGVEIGQDAQMFARATGFVLRTLAESIQGMSRTVGKLHDDLVRARMGGEP